MLKKAINIVLILVVGGFGGVLMDRLFFPYLATIPFLAQYDFITRVGNGTTIINPTERIVITENVAFEQAIEEMALRVVVVEARRAGRILAQATGFVITGDGLVATSFDDGAMRADEYLVYRNGDVFFGEIFKTDSGNGLSLLKIEANNLPVVVFADENELSLGQRVVLVGLEKREQKMTQFVNTGIIRKINDVGMETDIIEADVAANGGPLLDIKGQTVGMNLVNGDGPIQVILAENIKDLLLP